MDEFAALANRMADKAGEIIKTYFRQPFDVERKVDDSPVTIADREVEKALREMIKTERPDDGILGEEFGTEESKTGFTWVIDPIDGTKSFMIGRPTFGTLIALCEGITPKLGVIDQPISQERWIGIEGQQTTFNGQPVKTAPCTDFHDAKIGSTSPTMFQKLTDYGRAWELFETTGNRFSWGGDCYMYGLLASGFVDIVFEEDLSPYDFAALIPVVKGAGGHITDWRGDELTLKSKGQVIALGDPNLWPDVERMIRKSPY